MFKETIKALCSSMMIMTLILSPVSSGYAQVGMEDGETQDEFLERKSEEDGKEYKASGGDGTLYQAGGEFSKDMDKAGMSTSSDAYDNNVMQIIEQYLSLLFAMALLGSLFWDYTDRSIMDCPTNRAPSITLRVAQLGALAQIMGEVLANAEFREASKNAVDKNFAVKTEVDTASQVKETVIPGSGGQTTLKSKIKMAKARKADEKANSESNDKQIQAFDSLIEIYKGQKKGIEKKIPLSLAANAAYLTSMGLEIGYGISSVGICTSSQTTALTGYTTEAAVHTAVATAATAAAATPDMSGSQAAACTTLATLTAGLVVEKEGFLAANTAAGGVEAGKGVATEAKSAAKAVSWLGKIKNFFTGGKAPTGEQSIAQAMKQTEEIVDKASGTTAITEKKAAQAAVDATQGTMGVSPCAAVILAVEAAIADSKLVEAIPTYCCGSNIQFPVSAKDAAGITKGALGGMLMDAAASASGLQDAKEIANTLQDTMTKKISENATEGAATDAATGAVANLSPTFWNTPIPTMPGIQQYKTDIKFKGLLSAFSSRNNYMKEIIYSALQSVAQVKIYSKLNGKYPIKDLETFRKTDRFINNILEKNMFEIEKNEEVKEFIASIRKENQDISTFDFKGALVKIDTFLDSSSIIKSAQADVWGELLNLGTKFLLVNMMLKGFIQDIALNRPMARIVSFGIFGALGLILNKFQLDAKNEAGDRIKAVEREKNRYIQSATLRSVVKDEQPEEDKVESIELSFQPVDFSSPSGSTSCISSNGSGGFSPASCPQIVKMEDFRVPTIPRYVSNGNTRLEAASINALEGVVTTLASGQINNPKTGKSLVNGQLNTLLGNRVKLINKVKKLVKESDKNARKVGAGSLAKRLAGIDKMFPPGGSPFDTKAFRSGGVSKKDLAALKGINQNIGNLKRKKPRKAFKIPKINVPRFGSGLRNFESSSTNYGNEDTELGLDEVTTEESGEEKLDEFVINHDDINKRPELNIFQLISNRYILSIPKLMKKKK